MPDPTPPAAKCPGCNGKGQILYAPECVVTCSICNGTGTHPNPLPRRDDTARPATDEEVSQYRDAVADLEGLSGQCGSLASLVLARLDAAEAQASYQVAAEWRDKCWVAEAERDKLKAAIAEHHAQKADDRCVEDDDRLYAAAGLPPCDRRVGSKEEMLANCARFIDRRCEGGGWPSYRELEAERDAALAREKRLAGALRAYLYAEGDEFRRYDDLRAALAEHDDARRAGEGA